MAMTLIESAKLLQSGGNDLAAGVAMKFAESSNLLGVMPFETINGTAYRYNVEESLPGVGFRGLNEAFSESVGVINPQVEALKFLGGDMDVDRAIVDNEGAAARAAHIALKVKAAALKFDKTFIKGDSTSDPREFDGLQNRLGGSQVIANHATGAGLSIDKLREAIDQTDDPSAIIMSKAVRRLLTGGATNTSVGGFVTYDSGSFGRRVTLFDDLPILELDRDNENNTILDFSETGTTTSIYVVSFGDLALKGIQGKDLNARDLGEIDSKPVYRTRVDWDVSVALMGARAATRLKNITNAAVTA